MKMKKVAFLSMDSLDGLVCYDSLVYAPLEKLGWQAQAVSWRDKSVNWNDYAVVLIRSCWDYQQHPAAFLLVLEAIDKSSARLENPLALVNWNLDKKYLVELENSGINIVPTEWMTTFSIDLVMPYFSKFKTPEIVIKPSISANADNTFRLTVEQLQNSAPELGKIFKQRAFMVQPFIQNIVDEGEFSLFFFADEYSHTILKRPKARDFRVQEEHGGVLTTIEPEATLLNCARNVLATVSPTPLYSRVDLVRTNSGFALMELELIEPSLYFNMAPASPSHFARVFNHWMQTP